MVCGNASGGGREFPDGLPCLSSTRLFSNYRDCWFLWHFHRDRTETVTETATETVGFDGMIHRDRPGYRVNSKPTSVIVTVSVDHPTTTSICNGLCDGLCTFSVDRTTKANSLCAHNVHGRSCCQWLQRLVCGYRRLSALRLCKKKTPFENPFFLFRCLRK